jgi:hypothetical protein
VCPVCVCVCVCVCYAHDAVTVAGPHTFTSSFRLTPMFTCVSICTATCLSSLLTPSAFLLMRGSSDACAPPLLSLQALVKWSGADWGDPRPTAPSTGLSTCRLSSGTSTYAINADICLLLLLAAACCCLLLAACCYSSVHTHTHTRLPAHSRAFAYDMMFFTPAANLDSHHASALVCCSPRAIVKSIRPHAVLAKSHVPTHSIHVACAPSYPLTQTSIHSRTHSTGMPCRRWPTRLTTP